MRVLLFAIIPADQPRPALVVGRKPIKRGKRSPTKSSELDVSWGQRVTSLGVIEVKEIVEIMKDLELWDVWKVVGAISHP